MDVVMMKVIKLTKLEDPSNYVGQVYYYEALLVCEERWVRCWWLLLLFSCEMYGRNEVVSAFSTDPGSSQGYLVQRSAGCGELGSAISGDPHDVWSLSSSATRLCFVLRFWNHTFTCTNMVSTLVYTIRD